MKLKYVMEKQAQKLFVRQGDEFEQVLSETKQGVIFEEEVAICK